MTNSYPFDRPKPRPRITAPRFSRAVMAWATAVLPAPTSLAMVSIPGLHCPVYALRRLQRFNKTAISIGRSPSSNTHPGTNGSGFVISETAHRRLLQWAVAAYELTRPGDHPARKVIRLKKTWRSVTRWIGINLPSLQGFSSPNIGFAAPLYPTLWIPCGSAFLIYAMVPCCTHIRLP